jgi:hypothetical protein
VLEQAQHRPLPLPPARERDVGGVFGMGRNPVVPQRGELLGEQRIDGVRVAIEAADPVHAREAIGEALRPAEVLDAKESVVVLGVMQVTPLRVSLRASQP